MSFYFRRLSLITYPPLKVKHISHSSIKWKFCFANLPRNWTHFWNAYFPIKVVGDNVALPLARNKISNTFITEPFQSTIHNINWITNVANFLERKPSRREISFRDLHKVSIEKPFQRPLRNISRSDDLLWRLLKHLKHNLKIDVYSIKSLSRLKNTSCKYLWLFKNTI